MIQNPLKSGSISRMAESEKGNKTGSEDNDRSMHCLVEEMVKGITE